MKKKEMKKEENSNNQDHFENLSFISFLKNTLYTDSKNESSREIKSRACIVCKTQYDAVNNIIYM